MSTRPFTGKEFLESLRGGREITCLAVVATSLLLEQLITLP